MTASRASKSSRYNRCSSSRHEDRKRYDCFFASSWRMLTLLQSAITPPPTSDSMPGLTFNLSLTDRQRADREAVDLPYLPERGEDGIGTTRSDLSAPGLSLTWFSSSHSSTSAGRHVRWLVRH